MNKNTSGFKSSYRSVGVSLPKSLAHLAPKSEPAEELIMKKLKETLAATDPANPNYEFLLSEIELQKQHPIVDLSYNGFLEFLNSEEHGGFMKTMLILTRKSDKRQSNNLAYEIRD